MTDFDTELRKLQERIRRKAKIQSMLVSLNTQLTDLKAEEQRLAGILAAEQADVDSLEKFGLVSLFYAAINRKEEKLDRERAEAMAAAVKHDAAFCQMRAAEDEILSLQAQLSELTGVEQQYEKVFAQKTAAVKASNPAHAADICRIQDRLGYLAAQSKEIEEALSVGRTALSQIAVIEENLSGAEGWGTWDLFGGGFISDLAKHSHLDQAQEQISQLQITLNRYRTELADVTVYADIQVQIEGFLRFADFFFDGLFADWAVLDSIHSSQSQVASTRSQIEQTQHRLGEMKHNLDAEGNARKAELSDIVLKA